MPGGVEVLHRAPHGARTVRHVRNRPARSAGHATAPAHRATPSGRRSLVAAAAVLAALGGAAVTTVLLQSRDGLGAGAGQNPAAAGLDPSPVAVDTGGISCWDGTSAARVTECGVPAGRDGLATVFPSLDATCARTSPVVGGKEEVFTCRGSGYVIRYTRWQPGFDRFAVLSEVNRGVGSKWTVSREFAGRRWASREQTGDGLRHFRWAATYRAQPFSVEVQSSSLAGRSAGMAAVDAVSPLRLGRG